MPLYRPDVIAISASDATFQNTVRITGGANITVGTDASGISIVGGAGGGGGIAADIGGNSTSAGAGYITITNGTMLLAGGNNVTLSQNGSAITVSAFNQTVQTQNAVDVTLGGNTAGALALVSSGTLFLAGGNNIVLSQNAQSVTISASAQSVQIVQSAIQASNATYVSGNVIFTGVGGGVTVSSNTGQRVDISVAAPVAQTVQVVQSAIAAAGNTAGTMATITSGIVGIVGGQNITISQSTGAASTNLSILGPAAGAIEVGGIAASNTTYTSGNVVVSGVGGGVTINSAAGQHVDVSVAAPVAQTVQTQNLIDVTIGGNTAGASALVSSGTLTIAGGPNITVSQAGNAISISAAAPGGGAGATQSGWYSPFGNIGQIGRTATSSVSTPFVVPFFFDANATYSTAGVFLDCASTQSASTAALSMWFGIYTRETGASSTRLTLATSTSSAFTWTSSTGANSNWGGVSGVRRWEISGGTFNLTPGPYWAYVNMAKGNAGTFQLVGSQAGTGFAGIGLGSNTGGNFFPGAGASNAGSAGVPPNSFAISNINTGSLANTWQPAFILGNNLP